MAIPTKQQLLQFDAELDRELGRRALSQADANDAISLILNFSESSRSNGLNAGVSDLIDDGIFTFAKHLVSGVRGNKINADVALADLEFGQHYHRLRDILYYSFNAPGSIEWEVTEAGVNIGYRDRSFPRQFFTVWNEYVLGSRKLFEGFDGSQKLIELLKGKAEFNYEGDFEPVDDLLNQYADLKLSAYFSILDPNADIELGGYTYREAYALYRVLMKKALYHRYHGFANAQSGIVRASLAELSAKLTDDIDVPPDRIKLILRDLIYDRSAVADNVDPSYFSLMREGRGREDVLIRPFHFSASEGLIQFLRVVAHRRPQIYLSNVSNALGSAFVTRMGGAFEAQGFNCRAEVSLSKIDPLLPDIDLLVVSEEPTLGFVILVCELKSPLPPRWAKDQLRALSRDGVSKAFRQVEAISEFLKTEDGILFIRELLPEEGLKHFDGFVVALDSLIITSDNSGMFFDHERTPIFNFRTIERMLLRSDGDILHLRTCISTYKDAVDASIKIETCKTELGGTAIEYEGVSPTRLLEFPQGNWNSNPAKQEMIDEFVASGIHPFDSVRGHPRVVVMKDRRRR